jgi:hypothetical protein
MKKVCEKVELIARTGASVLISTAHISSFVAKLLANKGILSFHNIGHVYQSKSSVSLFSAVHFINKFFVLNTQEVALQFAQMTGATMISNITSIIPSQENEQTTGLLGCVPFVQYLPVQRILSIENEVSSKQNNLVQSSPSESEIWALVIALTHTSESKNTTNHESVKNTRTDGNDNSCNRSHRSKYLSLWLRGGKNLKQSIQRVTHSLALTHSLTLSLSLFFILQLSEFSKYILFVCFEVVRVGLCTFDTNSKSFWLLPGFFSHFDQPETENS